MATSNKLTGAEWNDLPLFAEGTPASLSAQQVTAKVKKILATCGLGYDKPLANYDPDTQSWKMSAGIFPWGEQPSLPILPPSGMTRNGELCQQPAWEPLTGGIASLSWPTPTTQDHIVRKSTQQKPGSMHSVGLGDAVKMWPTPTARDGKGAANYKSSKRNEADLTNQARSADGAQRGSLNPTWVEWLMGFPPGWTDLED
jgi:hypothetical protein